MSVIQHTAQRVAVLIDTQNLYHSARNLYGARVNFGAVLNEVVGERNLIRAVAYLITTESQDEAQFFDALLKMGIETKSKDLQIFHTGNKKADWDVGITVDAIRLASKVDTIILATGDGDFVPLVEHLKSLGVQVEVVSFGRSASAKLKESTEAFLDLDEDPSKYLLSKTINKYTNQSLQRNERDSRNDRYDRNERDSRNEKDQSQENFVRPMARDRSKDKEEAEAQKIISGNKKLKEEGDTEDSAKNNARNNITNNIKSSAKKTVLKDESVVKLKDARSKSRITTRRPVTKQTSGPRERDNVDTGEVG